MSEIPEDIWRYTSQFIPRHMLRNMFSVNRTFFDLAMNERYRDITFFQLDKQMQNLLDRLRYPLVRNRVRVLRIRPYFIQEVLDIQTVSCSLTPTSYVLQCLQDLFRHLTNLREYHIVWYDLPFVGDLPVQLLCGPFASSVYLQKLTLEASLHKLGSLLTPNGTLFHLEELDLSVRQECSEKLMGDFSVMINCLAPFINQNHHSLRCFSFQSSHSLNFAPFFRALGRFSSLKELAISIPTSAPHLGDPSGLQQFINVQSPSLQYLALRGYFIDDGTSWEPSFRSWVRSCFSNVTLSNLLSLTIATNFYHPEIITYCVQQFAKTLTSLDLTGRYMTYDQVATLTMLFAHRAPGDRLETLHLGPLTLSPQLVDLLAETLPALRELDIRMKDAVPHKDDLPLYSTQGFRKIRNQNPVQIDQFFLEMRKRMYRDWKLRHIAIWKFNSKLQFQTHYAQLFADCIPTLCFPESRN